jgi:hypothetical protein
VESENRDKVDFMRFPRDITELTIWYRPSDSLDLGRAPTSILWTIRKAGYRGL